MAGSVNRQYDDPHFRIDEQQRSIDELKKATSPESMGGFMAGIQAMMKAEIAAAKADTAADTRVADAIVKLTSAVEELLALHKNQPREKEVTAHLPSGPVTMRVRHT